jgi:hypothetical protein
MKFYPAVFLFLALVFSSFKIYAISCTNLGALVPDYGNVYFYIGEGSSTCNFGSSGQYYFDNNYVNPSQQTQISALTNSGKYVTITNGLHTFTSTCPVNTISDSNRQCLECPTGQYLLNGVCTAEPTCIGQQTNVNHVCVDPTCSAGTYLSNHSCVAEPTCIGDQTLTNHQCIDPTCPAGTYLSNHSCVAEPTCIGDQTLTNHQCIDPTCSAGYALHSGYCSINPPEYSGSTPLQWGSYSGGTYALRGVGSADNSPTYNGSLALCRSDITPQNHFYCSLTLLNPVQKITEKNFVVAGYYSLRNPAGTEQFRYPFGYALGTDYPTTYQCPIDLANSASTYNQTTGTCTASWASSAHYCPSDTGIQFSYVQGSGCVTDTDGDGVLDNIDNCPQILNADQSDTDGDTIGDACDNCLPNVVTETFSKISDSISPNVPNNYCSSNNCDMYRVTSSCASGTCSIDYASSGEQCTTPNVPNPDNLFVITPNNPELNVTVDNNSFYLTNGLDSLMGTITDQKFILKSCLRTTFYSIDPVVDYSVSPANCPNFLPSECLTITAINTYIENYIKSVQPYSGDGLLDYRYLKTANLYRNDTNLGFDSGNGLYTIKLKPIVTRKRLSIDNSIITNDTPTTLGNIAPYPYLFSLQGCTGTSTGGTTSGSGTGSSDAWLTENLGKKIDATDPAALIEKLDSSIPEMPTDGSTPPCDVCDAVKNAFGIGSEETKNPLGLINNIDDIPGFGAITNLFTGGSTNCPNNLTVTIFGYTGDLSQPVCGFWNDYGVRDAIRWVLYMWTIAFIGYTVVNLGR